MIQGTLTEIDERLLREAKSILGGGPVVFDADAFDKLSDRERQVFYGLAAGRNCQQIANELGNNVKTVDTQRLGVLRKLGLRNAAEVAIYNIQRRLALAVLGPVLAKPKTETDD